jgi:lysine 6-dehydrogenase
VGYRYAVLGAGRQGIAAAYDLAKFGQAEEIILVDIQPTAVQAAAKRIDKLLGRHITTALQADVSDAEQLAPALDGVASFISGVHYPLNPSLTRLAIRRGANMCDFGGNTDIVRKQLELDSEAKEAGITVVPDCGMGPGMNISLMTYAMSLVDRPLEAYTWEGGLLQDPQPPWNFALTFHIDGLSNEYSGPAYFLRNGQITQVPCLGDLEELDFPPPLGRLQAAVTSGGLSTTPWTFQGKLDRLENKTLRYPGHWAQMRAFTQLGLLELEPVKVGDVQVVPRDVLHALLEPKITSSEVRDVGVIRTKCVGEKDGRAVEVIVELIDYYDQETGFTAMQRLTGWHASIMAILAAKGQIQRGVVPVELAVPGATMVDQARRRGFRIEERVVPTK